MKVFAMLTVLLSSPLAFAMPAVGDQANYYYTQTLAAGDSHAGTLQMTITAKTPGAFEISRTLNFRGQTRSGKEILPESKFYSDQEIETIFQNCQGQMQKITVAAGTFDTCVRSHRNDTVWLGKVPFGLVKSIQYSTDGRQTYELTSSTRGN